MSDYCHGVWQDSYGYIWVADHVGFSRINHGKIIKHHPNGKPFGSLGKHIVLVNKIFYFDGGSFDGKSYKMYDSESVKLLYEYKLHINFLLSGDTISTRRYKIQNPSEKFGLIIKDSERVIGITNQSLDTLYFTDIIDFPEDPIYTINVDSIFQNKEEIKYVDFTTRNLSNIIISNNCFYFLTNEGVFAIDQQFNITAIITQVHDIYSITKTDENLFYVLSATNNYINVLAENGAIVKQILLKQNSKFFLDEIVSVKNEVFYSNGTSLYSLKGDKYELIGQFEAISQLKVSNKNELFFIAKMRGVSWLCVLNNGEVIKLLRTAEYASINQVLTDTEFNHWVILNGELFKFEFTPASINYYTSLCENSEATSSANQAIVTKEGLILDFYHNPSSNTTTIYINSNEGLDSLVLNNSTSVRYLGQVNEDVVLSQWTTNFRQNLLLFKRENFDLDTILSDSKGNQFESGFIIRNDSVFLLDEETLKYYSFQNDTEKLFDSDLLLFANDAPSQILTQLKYKIDLDSLSQIFGSSPWVDFAIPGDLVNSLFIENSLVLSAKDGSILSVEKIGPEFQPDGSGYGHFTLLKNGVYIYLTINSQLAFYNANSNQFSHFDAIVEANLNVIDDVSFCNNNLYVVSNNVIYEITVDALIGLRFKADPIVQLPYKSIRRGRLSSTCFEKKILFQFSSEHEVYAYSLNFVPKLTELKISESDIYVYNINGDLVSRDNRQLENLDHDQNSITFDFEVISNYLPESTTYEFRLLGSQNERWIRSLEDSVVFSNLSPAEYTFQYRALNPIGIESRIVEYFIRINPPWWQTIWYQVLQAVVFISLLLITYFLSKRGATPLTSFLTMLTLIVIFELIIMCVSGFIDTFSHGVPIFRLIGNVLLAFSLKPIDRLGERIFNMKHSE